MRYRTDGNLAARQSIYVCQHPRIDLPDRVLDLAIPAAMLTDERWGERLTPDDGESLVSPI